ncbi:MAG: hypothetical protein RLP08_22285 [Marinovum algicola]|uniref:hypothetical protein n=2 Tax=Roseobacteraceae TaxID=2854170 RepID=UPI0032EEF48F
MPVTLLRFSGEGLRDPLFSRPMSRFVRDTGLQKDWRDFYDGTLLHHDAADADGAEPGEDDLRLWQALNARADTET